MREKKEELKRIRKKLQELELNDESEMEIGEEERYSDVSEIRNKIERKKAEKNRKLDGEPKN